VLQMLDISFFKALKSQYRAAAKRWLDCAAGVPGDKPYLNKQVFIELFRTAWVASTKPVNAINGWKAMGLESCPKTGMVCINRYAIKDYKLASSDKYKPLLQAGVKQAVRVCTGTDALGTYVYKDYDFDLTHDGLDNLRREKPEVYAMHVASKTYIMQQDGMPMHQPSVKACQIAHPLARVLTTTAMLSVAKEKDNVKNAKLVKKKRNSLAQIGKELGTSVFVDGKDVVEELKMKGVRCHYCAYCKQTLVRPCAKAKCKREAGGDYVGGTTKRPNKRVKRVHPTNGKDAIDADESHGVDNAKKISGKDASQPWLTDPDGQLAVGQKFLLSCLTDDLLDNGIIATVTGPIIWTSDDGIDHKMLEFKYKMPVEGDDDTDFSQVSEVYEAIMQTKRMRLTM